MAVLTISGIIGLFAGGISAIASIGAFLAGILILPFKLAGDNKELALTIYWVVFLIDSFFVTTLTNGVLAPLYELFNIAPLDLGFTSIYLIVINIATVPLLGWYFVPIHLLMLASLLILIRLIAWVYLYNRI